jgi:predicted RNA-binding protein YlxR (DUF448 family)
MSDAIRTCVGCRRSQPQGALLRVRRVSDGAVVTATRRGSGAAARGRSAYICPLRPCLEQAVRRGGFARAFARAGRVHPDGEALWVALAKHVHEERELLERSSRTPAAFPRFHQLLAFETAMASGRGA